MRTCNILDEMIDGQEKRSVEIRLGLRNILQKVAGDRAIMARRRGVIVMYRSIDDPRGIQRKNVVL